MPLSQFSIVLAWRNEYFCNVGKYIATSPNIEQEIQNLYKGLSKNNKIWLLRQISRAKHAYESGKDIVNLIQQKINELTKIHNEFYPNIFKISENLYSYDGFLVPRKISALEVFYHKHNLHILEPQTLAKIRQKDIIDVGRLSEIVPLFLKEILAIKTFIALNQPNKDMS